MTQISSPRVTLNLRRISLLAVIGIAAALLIGLGVSKARRGAVVALNRPQIDSSARVAQNKVDLLGKSFKSATGFVYLLDSNNGEHNGRVLVVNPEQGNIVATFETGYDPDMALSPDGSRLLILSTDYGNQSTPHTLSIINTETGDVTKRVNVSDRWLYNVIPPATSMAVSSNGKFLYLLKYHVGTSADDTLYWMSTLDIDNGVFLPEIVSLNRCEIAQFLPQQQVDDLRVICSETNDVRFLRMTTRGNAAISTVRLPSVLRLKDKGVPRPDRVIHGYASDGKVITVMRDGRVLETDRNVPNAVRESGTLLLSPGRNVVNVAASSGRLYVGVGSAQGGWIGDSIVVLDKRTLVPSGTINVSHRFTHLAVNGDGGRIYAIDTDGATLTVIDAATGREIKTIEHVGTTPTLMLVAP